MSGVTWEPVGRALVNRWPSGPAFKGWEDGQADAIVAKMKEDVLTPMWALVGLRASESAAVPCSAEVRELAFRTMRAPLL